MNKNMLLLSLLLLSSHQYISAKKETTKAIDDSTTSSEKATKKASKPKAPTIVLKTGEHLPLAEFTKTNSGIMYKTTKAGTGKKPLAGEMLTVHYDGYLLDGTKVGLKFDSSVDRDMPFKFKLGARQVITGWEISLADMKMGETRVVILPAKEAYGSRATSKIPANSSLIFEITLIQAS